MKSLITAAAIFASSTLAAKYAAGTNCHTNVECEANCVDKQYTIVNEDGGYIFVCDPSLEDATQWYQFRCLNVIFGGIDPDVTKAACNAVGGQFCYSDCIVSGKRTEQEENRAKWKASCVKDSQGSPTAFDFYVMMDEESAKTYC